MNSNSPNLDHLRIATPCPISWEQMHGDDHVRFCDHCHLNVYNISALSRGEAEKLIASTEGRLCARLFRRADGTVLTKDCPVGLRALRMRMSKKAATIFAAVVSLSAVVFGQQGSSKNEKTACTPQTRITRKNATSGPNEKVLSGTLVDPNGAVIFGVKVNLVNAALKQTREITTNDDGRFEFAALEPGTYSITIEEGAFKALKIKSIDIKRGQLTTVDITLEPRVLMGVVGILAEEPSLLDTPPGTTIITGKMIQSLPHQK